eukprot:COSAG01_NODE_45828_length_405_cov_79.235294_1_plen_26_part_01
MYQIVDLAAKLAYVGSDLDILARQVR